MIASLRLTAYVVLVLSSSSFLTACVTDKSCDSRLSTVMHKCFRTTDDSVLYQTNKCPPNGGMSTTSTCTTLKYLSSFSPPVTLSEFNSNLYGAATRVAERITPPASGGLLNPAPRVKSLGAVTRGTSFTIEAMRRFSHPE